MASSASIAGTTVAAATTAASTSSTGVPDLIEYKVKLLGLLPDGYMYSQGPTRWDLTTASFCKVPSEMTCYDGKIDKKGHPTLIGSGILERKYGLTVQLPTIAESERAASVARSSIKGKIFACVHQTKLADKLLAHKFMLYQLTIFCHITHMCVLVHGC